MHPQFDDTFYHFPNVPVEMRESFWNYLAYGIDPGSFGMAVLCNNFMNASVRAHPALTVACFRDIAKWFQHHVPREAYGGIDNVMEWKTKTDQERMDIMIAVGLRPSEFDILRGRAVP